MVHKSYLWRLSRRDVIALLGSFVRHYTEPDLELNKDSEGPLICKDIALREIIRTLEAEWKRNNRDRRLASA